MYLRYAMLAPISLAMNILVMILSPALALIPAAFRLENLPGPLWYLQTHDHWVYGDGWPRPAIPPTFGMRWKLAMWWLARNPAYAFDAYALGFAAGEVRMVSAVGTSKADGIYDRILLLSGKELFGYRRDFFYRAGGTRYCKLWFGWSWKPQEGRHMLKFDINPFKRNA